MDDDGIIEKTTRLMAEDVLWMAQRMDLTEGYIVGDLREVRVADTRYTRLLRRVATTFMDVIEKELDDDNRV
jgi:hypothetical protein